MDPWLQSTITIVCSVIASSGFWAFIQTKLKKNSIEDEVLVGLAHVRIIEEGQRYVARGWITHEEYDDFIKYLAQPYLDYGANGLAKLMIKRVGDLPLKSISELTESEKEVYNKGYNNG